jgi:chromosomal replication initiation ATPase DnaA
MTDPEMDAAKSIGQIIKVVASRHGLHPHELTDGRIVPAYVAARHEAIWVARQRKLEDGRQRWSFPIIGRRFQGQLKRGMHHTSAMHACDAHLTRLWEQLAATLELAA